MAEPLQATVTLDQIEHSLQAAVQFCGRVAASASRAEAAVTLERAAQRLDRLLSALAPLHTMREPGAEESAPTRAGRETVLRARALASAFVMENLISRLGTSPEDPPPAMALRAVLDFENEVVNLLLKLRAARNDAEALQLLDDVILLTVTELRELRQPDAKGQAEPPRASTRPLADEARSA